VILVDTSIWVDHFRRGLPELSAALESSAVLGHPWVTGELALGGLNQRDEILALLTQLPQASLATPDELLTFSSGERLFAAGVGYVDVQLLAGTRLTAGAVLWTQDGQLRSAATRMGIAFESGDEGVER